MINNCEARPQRASAFNPPRNKEKLFFRAQHSEIHCLLCIPFHRHKHVELFHKSRTSWAYIRRIIFYDGSGVFNPSSQEP
jgi:hypothetical protein